MLLIRLFETAMHRLFLAGEIHGTTHLGAGQERVAVGNVPRAGAGRLPGRHVSGPWARTRQRDRSRAAGGRDAGPRHRGVAAACRLDERDRPGTWAGRLLRHRRRIDRRRAGRRVVGQAPGAGVGGAVRRRRDQPGVLSRVPEHGHGVLVAGGVRVRRNNFYGEFTPMASVTAGADIAGRARAYAMPSATVDGNDVWAVHAARIQGGGASARRTDGPTLLECRTYRHYGHSKGDPATYRPKQEVEHLARARSV